MNIRFSNRFVWLLVSLILISIACQSTSTPTQSPASDQNSQAGQSAPGVSEITNAPSNLPEKRANQAGDADSSSNASRKLVSGGDKFIKGLYERPFNAETMDIYFPHLDIIDTQGFKDEEWGYATITLSGTDGNGKLPGKYGVELDLNRDGRGEWLILASNPSSTDWTTEGVQVWNDANGEIGEQSAMVGEEHPKSGDGYEALVFDQGDGNNTDGAWVRISETDSKTLLIAFSLSMIGNTDSFAMGAWAGNQSLDPALFDHNDHMTHAQAGSPLPDLNVYPLLQLAEIDNTCRMSIGFVPSGNEPGLCETVLKEQQGDPKPGCTPPAAGMMNPCP